MTDLLYTSSAGKIKLAKFMCTEHKRLGFFLWTFVDIITVIVINVSHVILTIFKR